MSGETILFSRKALPLLALGRIRILRSNHFPELIGIQKVIVIVMIIFIIIIRKIIVIKVKLMIILKIITTIS